MRLGSATLLERYQILAPLGEGGMGEVYRAKDLRLERDIAIKVLPEHLGSDPEALARFEREAKAVAALSHPNILAIHDFGTDQGVAFAVTELLEGETLRDRVAAGAIPWRAAAGIGVEIAEGLAAAHSRGIVHRDLKPENIFLTADGRVKILDFGLARRQEPRTPADANSAPTTPASTEPGTVLGTIGYMAPEQVRGETADARSDIFAFGCVLYEMASGRRAFPGQSPAERMASILRDDPPDFSSAAGAPADFLRVMRHCLDKSPAGRFQSARDLAFALKAIPADPVLPVPIPAPLRPKARVKSLAILPFVNAGGDPEMDYLSDGITESLIASLSRLPRMRVMARSTVFRFRGDADPQQVGRELEVGAVLTGRVTRRGESLTVQAELVDASNGWRLWGDQYRRGADDVQQVQEEITREIGEKLRLALSPAQKKRLTRTRAVSTEAFETYLKGRYYWNKGGIPNLQKALAYFQDAIARDPDYALAYTGIADCYTALGMDKYGALSPADAFPRAREAARRALEIDESLAEAHTALGFVSMFDWDFTTAETAFRRAIALNPNYAQAHEYYGFYLAAMGRFDEAIEQMSRARDSDPLSLNMLASFGWVYLTARRYEESVEQCRRALELDPNFVQAHLWKGMACTDSGRYEEAIATFRAAAELTKGNSTMLGSLGRAYLLSGRRKEAEEILEDLEERHRKGEYVTSVSMVLLYASLGRNEEAFQWLEKAYEGRASFLMGLNVYAFFDGLRSDPRFADLLSRIGFPASRETSEGGFA